MNRSDQINELAAALAKAQGEIKGAVKDATNPHFRSSYADLQSVWDAIREPLSKNGLSVMQFPLATYDPDGTAYIHVETALAHTSGQWVSSSLTMTPERSTPQAFGSAITYARRYALQSIAGVAPMDDDGEAAEGRGGHPERGEEHFKTMKGRTPQRPTETQEITGKWQDVICHIGKANGPIKGKALGQIPNDTKGWLIKTLREKDETKLPAADRRLLAALCMWEAESQPKSQDRIVPPPPAAGSAKDEAIKAITGLLEWNGIPEEIFWSVGMARKWFEKHGWDNVTEAEAVRVQENIEAAIGHCQAAMTTPAEGETK